MSLKNRIASFFGVNTNVMQFNAPQVKEATVTWIDDNVSKYISEGYMANDIVYSIGQITAEKIKAAPWGVYKVKDEQALKSLHREQSKKAEERNYKKEQDLQFKALEAYNGDGKLSELLKYPNEHESFSDLVAHSSIAKMMTGNRFIQAVLLDGGANQGKPQELHLLPSQYMSILTNREYPIRTASYELSIGNPKIPFTKEEILHDKYYNPSYDITGTHLYGLSPLKAALKTLANENSSLEASTKSFQNMGSGKAMWIDDDRLSGADAATQAGALKKKYMEEYTGTKASKSIMVSGYKLGLADMGLSPVDLNILEQQKWNLIRFCNIWNFPHLLLLPDHATDNNAGWAERSLTSRCALPLMTSFRDNFNRELQQDWGYKGQNIYVDYDQSVYSELEINRKEAAEWIKNCYFLPERMKYELMNLETPEYVDEAFLNSVHIPSGLVRGSDLDIKFNED